MIVSLSINDLVYNNNSIDPASISMRAPNAFVRVYGICFIFFTSNRSHRANEPFHLVRYLVHDIDDRRASQFI